MSHLSTAEKAALLSETPIPEKSLLGIPTDPKDWFKFADACVEAAEARNTAVYDWHADGAKPGLDEIFVFGSNLAGVHGAGAARHAYDNLGASWGVGTGLTGLCYALPTKDKNIHTLPLDSIEYEVAKFKIVARANPGMKFFVTRVGCGLAGIPDAVMVEFFRGSPPNCVMTDTWKPYFEGTIPSPDGILFPAGGFRKGEFFLIASRDGTGKSTIQKD